MGSSLFLSRLSLRLEPAHVDEDRFTNTTQHQSGVRVNAGFDAQFRISPSWVEHLGLCDGWSHRPKCVRTRGELLELLQLNSPPAAWAWTHSWPWSRFLSEWWAVSLGIRMASGSVICIIPRHVVLSSHLCEIIRCHCNGSWTNDVTCKKLMLIFANVWEASDNGCSSFSIMTI